MWYLLSLIDYSNNRITRVPYCLLNEDEYALYLVQKEKAKEYQKKYIDAVLGNTPKPPAPDLMPILINLAQNDVIHHIAERIETQEELLKRKKRHD